MLTTDQKGAIAETAIAFQATELGIEVYRPVAEGGRFDMLFLLLEGLVRVQCKWARRQGDVIVVPCYSCRRAREGIRKRLYTPDEVDALAAYSPDTHTCYYLPLNKIGVRSYIQLRLGPTRNNQHRGVNWAEDFAFAATLRPPGAIAQLGERRAGSAKVAGSSPAGSTLFGESPPV
jgi:hypothetical protein